MDPGKFVIPWRKSFIKDDLRLPRGSNMEKEEDDSRVWLLASDASMIEVEEEADLRSVNVFDGI